MRKVWLFEFPFCQPLWALTKCQDDIVVADMVADMEVDTVANKVDNMVADMFVDIATNWGYPI